MYPIPACASHHIVLSRLVSNRPLDIHLHLFLTHHSHHSELPSNAVDAICHSAPFEPDPLPAQHHRRIVHIAPCYRATFVVVGPLDFRTKLIVWHRLALPRSLLQLPSSPIGFPLPIILAQPLSHLTSARGSSTSGCAPGTQSRHNVGSRRGGQALAAHQHHS